MHACLTTNFHALSSTFIPFELVQMFMIDEHCLSCLRLVFICRKNPKQSIEDFTFCRPSQILRIYRIVARSLSPSLATLCFCVIGGLDSSNRELVMSEVHPRTYLMAGTKLSFHMSGNNRRPSQKSGMRWENRNAADSSELSPTIPDDRGYL